MLDAATEPRGLAGLGMFSAAVPDHVYTNIEYKFDIFNFPIIKYGKMPICRL